MRLKVSITMFFVFAFALFSMVFTGSGSASQQETYTLKVDAFWGPEYHATKNAVLPSLKAIEEKSNGRIKFDIYYAQSLAKTTEGYDATAMGITDVYWFTGPNYETGSMPRGSIFSLPFALPLGKENVDEASKIMYQIFQDHVKQEIISDVKVVGWGPLSAYRFMSVDKIENMEDLEGLTLRSSGGYHDDIIQAVGASPESMAPGDIYEALERGILDGVFHTYAAQYGWGTYEPMDYSTDLGITTFPFYTIINKKTFESLPEDLQKIIADTFKEYAPKAGISYYNTEEEFFPEMGLEEVDLSQEEESKIMKATIVPVWKEWISTCKEKNIDWKTMIQDLAKAWEDQGLTPMDTWVQLAQ